MKMWVLMLISSFVMISNAAEDLVILKAGEQKRFKHRSDGGAAESHWKLEACEGCKLITSCYLSSKNCDELTIIINDGETVEKHCNPEWATTFLVYSKYNEMEITIKTNGPSEGTFCHTEATKPYTNMEYNEIDSSEYGLGTGATRQPSCKCGWANKNPARIVGGKETLPNEYPFTAMIKFKDLNQPICGGSIISAYHILTAANCTYPYRGFPFAVVVGEHDYTKSDETPFTKEIDVKEIYEHPKFDKYKLKNNIAIALLEEKIEFNNAVGPVCLPNSQTNLLGEYIKVLGWGYTEEKGRLSNVLLKTHLRPIDLSICQAVFSSTVDVRDPQQICAWAPNRDICQDDFGGPLVWRDPETNRYVQVAIASLGRVCGSTNPAVNTDVSYFMDWIRKIISDTVPQEVCV